MTTEQLAPASGSAEAEAYRDALLIEPAAAVALLRDVLGAGAVARVAGVSETRAVHDWAEARRAIRSAGVEARLRLAYQAVVLIQRVYPPEVAARWFDTPSPYLGYRSPAAALAGAAPDDVAAAFMAAAVALVS
jgi:hypothetical protein